MTARHLMAAALTLVAFTACGPEDSATGGAMDGSEFHARDRSPAAPPAPPPPPPMYRDDMATGGEESERGGGAVGIAPTTSAAARQLIRTGHVTIRVEAVEPAVERLRAMAAELGGFVGNVSVHTGDEQLRQATIHMRVPAARFDDAVAAVRPLGTVEAVNISAQDVTEQHADLEARLANARRLEERLLDLLATRTGDLQQVLAAERELARVRTEIELYDGRLRQIEDRVEMSTLTVQLREPRPILGGRPGESVIGDAFRQAWRNFVWTIAGIIAISGALIPLALILAAVLAPVVYWLRRRRARRRSPGAG